MRGGRTREVFRGEGDVTAGCWREGDVTAGCWLRRCVAAGGWVGDAGRLAADGRWAGGVRVGAAGGCFGAVAVLSSGLRSGLRGGGVAPDPSSAAWARLRCCTVAEALAALRARSSSMAAVVVAWRVVDAGEAVVCERR